MYTKNTVESHLMRTVKTMDDEDTARCSLRCKSNPYCYAFVLNDNVCNLLGDPTSTNTGVSFPDFYISM